LDVGNALRRGDMAAAMDYSEQAIRLGIEDPKFLSLAGQARIRNGQVDRAYPLFARARELAPNNVEVLNGLGICFALMGRPRESLAAFDDALTQSPDAMYLKLHRAQALEDVGQLREAQTALEKILSVEPDNTQALERLANICARRGDMASARGNATRALKLAPNPGATIALVAAELADKQFARALQLIAPLAADPKIGPINQSIALGLLGDALDGLERAAEAFGAYVTAREVLRGSLDGMLKGQDSAIGRVRRVTSYFRTAPNDAWRICDPVSAARQTKTHVFLVGFPRSGTTLLEQALAGHRDVRTMEEVDCLGDTVGEFFYATDGMERFAALDQAELAKLRSLYWQAVDATGAKTDRAVFVDKMPLSSVHQGLIARLFPAAKILFTLRDPRDVVLSCFRRRLVMTAQMREFSTIGGAADFYDAVMELAQIYRDRLGLQRLDVRHEDLVADFDGEMHRVCDFLDIGWDASISDFAAQVRTRDVKTPSAHQIVRGLNRDGVGQWRRFRAQLEPILPILAPWAERFGYKDM
jgi:Flp pilus assembly protein TadD